MVISTEWIEVAKAKPATPHTACLIGYLQADGSFAIHNAVMFWQEGFFTTHRPDEQYKCNKCGENQWTRREVEPTHWIAVSSLG